MFHWQNVFDQEVQDAGEAMFRSLSSTNRVVPKSLRNFQKKLS